MIKNIDPNIIEDFKSTINKFQTIPDEDFAKLIDVVKLISFKKGEMILNEGKICKHLWFIYKGCFRIFSIEDGVEKNVKFYFEKKIASDFISLRHGIPSNFYMVAMEDCEVLVAYKPNYNPLLTFSKPIIQLTASFFQQCFFNELEHSNTFKLLNPEERYKYLEEKRPRYIQRIPLTYLASYLGMSRKTLSRIRSGNK